MSLKSKILCWILALLSLPALAAPRGHLELASSTHLAARASDSTDITLPGYLFKMLGAGANDDPAAQQVLTRLDSIRIRSYTFDTDHAYTDEDVAPLRRQLLAEHWSPLVRTRDHQQGEQADVYICMDERSACGLAIVVTAPKEFTVVNLVGQIPLEQVETLSREWRRPHGT